MRAFVCVKELKNDSLTCGSNRDRSLENTTSVPATDHDLLNEQASLGELLDTTTIVDSDDPFFDLGTS